MIKKIIPVIFFLLNLLFLQTASGQNSLNIPEYITQRFQSYCKSVPREEIFIHTDKEEYISGEDLWFNIYLIDRQTSKPSLNSRIVYFEILNPENKPVLQKRILIDKGTGPGQVELPDTLSSGTYRIRAYTNWMKNFLPYDCFLKDISVYNAFKTKTFIRSVRIPDNNEAVTDTMHTDSGLKLKVNNFRYDSLEIFLQTNQKFRSDNKNIIYLFIQSRGIINHLSTEKTDNELTRITISKKSLQSGINQITIFDLNGPVRDRFIYTPVKDKQVLTLNSIDSCRRRNKVTLSIEAASEMDGLNDLTNISISVASSTNRTDIMDMSDYLVFGTEFGFLPWRTFKGKKLSELQPDVMDSLLLTVKSNWINWEKIFSNDEQYYKYPSEDEEHYLSGRLLTSNLGPEDQGEILFMSTPGKEAVLQYTRTDKEGNFNFGVKIDDNLKDLIIMPENRGKNQKIYVESSFSDQYFPTEVFVDSIKKTATSSVSRQVINYQVGKIYGSLSVGKRLTPFYQSNKSKRFYGTPDFVLIMKDFIKLDSMQEVFFELIPHIAFQRIYKGYEMSVTDRSGNKLSGIPYVLIDGVIVKDLSVIANLDPGLVEKIDVVWDKYRVGDYVFNGIVNVITKAGDFSNVNLPADAVRLHYKVLDPVSSFISPDYSSTEMKNSRIADFRNTLYWNPAIKPDKNGKATVEFWTADVKSDYIINIQGITSNGTQISFKKRIRVY